MSVPRKASDRGVAIHPGEFLREDFMKPLGLSANALAIALRVPVTRINEIVRERRGITVETAMRFGQYFGTTPDFWMNMQQSYELALGEKNLLRQIRAEVRPAPRDRKTGELKHQARFEV
jgi:antitoxin HigA-1